MATRSTISAVWPRACSAADPDMLDIALSMLMLCAAALTGGAIFLLRRGERQRPVLMIGLALVMATNVVIWTLPTPSGETLVEKARQK